MIATGKNTYLHITDKTFHTVFKYLLFYVMVSPGTTLIKEKRRLGTRLWDKQRSNVKNMPVMPLRLRTNATLDCS